MQYLVSVIDDKSKPGSTDRQPEIGAFNERLIAAGHWVFAGGLADPDAATVIDNRSEQTLVSDGPFVESKEYLAGVWVWEVQDPEVALELATEASRSATGRSSCGRSSERCPRGATCARDAYTVGPARTEPSGGRGRGMGEGPQPSTSAPGLLP